MSEDFENFSKVYEFVTFDGELLFHNGRKFHPKARFVGFDSELDVYQYIIDHRNDSGKSIYSTIEYVLVD